MNLADYLSELLGQQDEVSIPGLGYFVRMHVNASYNDSEARFYPPYHQVKFVPKFVEDESFAQYVAQKKSISLASSKYFIEKFIGKLKEDSARGKFLFADLGSFQNEADQLVFKPNDRIPADPAFYGYPPVGLFKLNQPLSFDSKKPVFNQTQTPVLTAAVASQVDVIPEPQYYEDEIEQKRGMSVWLIILFAVAFIALALFGVYKFYPEGFSRASDEYDKLTGRSVDNSPPVVHPYIKTKTVKKAPAVKDTIAKTVTPLLTPITKPDTVKPLRFELVASSFRQLGWANNEVKHLKARGLDAKILTDAPGPRLKVSVGAFPTLIKADSAKTELVKERKISSSSQVIEIKP